MTRSMTAFARTELGAAVWELRSVNHRYLDVSFRMPENLRFLETELKALFKDKVHRGKVECSLKINPAELSTSFTINEQLVTELKSALERVSELTGYDTRGDAMSLLRWPDVLETTENSETLAADVAEGFKDAIVQLVDMRDREGAELAKMIESRLVDIESTVTQLHQEVPAIIQTQHEKLRKRMDEIDVDVDPGRLEQELVVLAQKLDVEEELDRLVTHVAEVRRTLQSDEPVGRRLDFLMQELNREANTISSKASAASTTNRAVDLKVVIEQMREQIQNIE
ncbi:MAG: YicC family protein [Pseudomonadales bacterium]|nr:YicC family protein [Pseudomonadales bacterium]MBO6563658.1 YicC family protein [Pseudomonadales bacterium]MBO6596672.1 YicC family protein [Pseudomonadales bacterium]MBO6655973.1 YicC family protein [Pseudomonadales bacterium]MBO6703343.1 YicC family protein [Pseudomonadales bacterium]